MKIFTLLIFIITYQQSMACSCMAVPILDRIAESDFVATAKIVDLIPDQQNNYLANIDIEIIVGLIYHPPIDENESFIDQYIY